MNRVLITGSTGFVGSNLIPYLIRGNMDIQTLTRSELQNVNRIEIKDCDAIVHLAGKAHDLKMVSDPDEYYEINTHLTQKLYDSFLKSSANKFIFISSVKAAADSVEGALDEDMIPSPQTHYGKSKLIAEEYIQAQPLSEGKSYYILRPCMIHGPGNKGNLNLLYKIVQKSIPYPLAAFENKRSFLSVENLCFIIQQMLNKEGIVSGIYQAADDQALSTNNLVSILAKSLNKTPRLWHISKSLIHAIAKLGDHLKLPLNSERLYKLTESYVVSNAKIKRALGAELPLSAEDGLKITASSFRRASFQLPK